MILKLFDLCLHVIHLSKYPLIDLFWVISVIYILREIDPLNLIGVDYDLPEVLLKLEWRGNVDDFVHDLENVLVFVKIGNDVELLDPPEI